MPHLYYKPSDLILPIYSHLIIVYAAKSVVEWPKKINDKEALKRLYEGVFKQLFEIQRTILNILGQDSQSDMNVVPAILDNLFLLYPERLDIFVEVFERFNIVDEATPVIDSLWRTGSSFSSTIIEPYQQKYPELAKPEPFENWKDFLRIWRIIKDKYVLHYSVMF